MASLLTPAVALPILGVIGVLAAVYLVVQLKASKTATPVASKSTLQTLMANPILSHLVSQVATRATANSHAVLDALAVKMVPAIAPFIPAVNTAADLISHAVVGTPPPTLPQPGDPATRPIIDFLEAHLAQLKGLKP